MINFLYSAQNPGPGNRWRNVVTVVLLILALGVGFGYSQIEREDFVAFKQKLLSPQDLSLLNFSEDIGGDLSFEPEPMRVPTLSPSSTPLDPAGFSAKYILVKDVETGTVLFSKDPYLTHPIASITKLMTALVLLEFDPDWSATTVVIGPDNLDTHVYAGETYRLGNLWHTMLIASSNKAALSLVNAVSSQEEFVARMNERAKELGMSDTTFVDVTGIGEGNISSASDIIILLQEALRQGDISKTIVIPEYSLYSSVKQKNHHMWSTNWLLLNNPKPWIYHNFDTVIGGKTGHISAAGFNFAVEVSKDNHPIDIVILGADSNEHRFTEAREVGEWVYTNYDWPDKL